MKFGKCTYLVVLLNMIYVWTVLYYFENLAEPTYCEEVFILLWCPSGCVLCVWFVRMYSSCLSGLVSVCGVCQDVFSVSITIRMCSLFLFLVSD